MAIADTSDSGGRVTGYSWNFGDGSSAVTSQFASHSLHHARQLHRHRHRH